jgi:hypothetical protein
MQSHVHWVVAAMNEGTWQTIIIALLGTGGATFVWTVAKSVIAYRDSAEGREDKAVGRLEAFEAECRRQLAWEREMGAHWYRVAGILEHTLAVHGVDIPPLPQQPHPLGPEEK